MTRAFFIQFYQLITGLVRESVFWLTNSEEIAKIQMPHFDPVAAKVFSCQKSNNVTHAFFAQNLDNGEVFENGHNSAAVIFAF